MSLTAKRLDSEEVKCVKLPPEASAPLMGRCQRVSDLVLVQYPAFCGRHFPYWP
jgi:hypothetical protein